MTPSVRKLTTLAPLALAVALSSATFFGQARAQEVAQPSQGDKPSCYDSVILGQLGKQTYIDTPTDGLGPNDLPWLSRFWWRIEVFQTLAGERAPDEVTAIGQIHSARKTGQPSRWLFFLRHIDDVNVVIYFDIDPPAWPKREAARIIREMGLRQCGPADRTIHPEIHPPRED